MELYVESSTPCILKEFHAVHITEPRERNLRNIRIHFTNAPLITLVNTQNVSVTKIVDTSSIQRAENQKWP